MCFILMFAYSCNSFQVFLGVFSQVFYKYVSSVSTAFSRMLQLLFFYVSKVDRVLHCVSAFLLPRLLSLSPPFGIDWASVISFLWMLA